MIIPAGKRLGLISQIPVYPAGYTVEDVLRTAFDDLKAMEQEMEALSDQLAGGDAQLLAQYDRLQAAYETGGGYEIETRLEKNLLRPGHLKRLSGKRLRPALRRGKDPHQPGPADSGRY